MEAIGEYMQWCNETLTINLYPEKLILWLQLYILLYGA